MLKKLDYVKVLIGVAIGASLLAISGNVINNLEISRICSTKSTTRVIKVQESRPSYSYLKAITVLIKGKRVSYDELSGKINYKTAYMGTGVIIKVTESYTYILTNKHIADSKYVQVVMDGKEEVRAKIIKADSEFDIAVLRIRGKLANKKVAKGFALGYTGEKVYMVGHHLGFPYIYGEGAVAGFYNLYMLVQLPVMWGNSGSAVVNKDGYIVGLVFAIPYTVIQNILPVFDVAHGWAVPSLYITTFLKTIPELEDLDLTIGVVK